MSEQENRGDAAFEEEFSALEQAAAVPCALQAG